VGRDTTIIPPTKIETEDMSIQYLNHTHIIFLVHEVENAVVSGYLKLHIFPFYLILNFYIFTQ